MSVEQAFILQLLDHPDDDVTRLVYADWLEEQGDQRGLYLRGEIELARLNEHDGDHQVLEVELRHRRAGIEPAWLERTGKRFDVILHGYAPHKKIATIKLYRELTAHGLYAAKCFCETLPACLLVGVTRAQAEMCRDRFRQTLGQDVDVEVVATSGQPIYSLVVGRLFEDHIVQLAPVLANYINTSTEEAMRLLSNPPAIVRRDLPMAEATSPPLFPPYYVPFVVRRMDRDTAAPRVQVYPEREHHYRVELRRFDSADRSFVAAVLALVLDPERADEAEALLDHLPVVIHAEADGPLALWTWQRFRGQAEVAVVPE